ncbi:DUF7667 family protein [Paenibacillus lactis]|uniref:DUF7667 family protein n=2 Tax=Paenibacillus lactis TaxID=228574 RepID=UPI001B1E613B|nr:hypothetical protein [Paenibacillus lactis]GIO90768.1 hypothetical protein J31TS3_19950 [Paenibacillus lactis]
MFGIHSVHRRLAELTEKADRLGGFNKLAEAEQKEITHCLIVNAKITREVDELLQLSFIAYQANDTDWQMEICRRLDQLRPKFT